MEEKKDYTGGTINAIIIIGFILAIIFQRFDLFVWVLSITFMLYIFAKSLLNRIGNSVSDKVTQRRRELSSGGGVNPRPIIPKPDTVPSPQKNNGGQDIALAPIALSGDTRKDTIAAIRRIPNHVQAPHTNNRTIPILYDGASWHYFTLHSGHWGIFGISGSGKGNVIRKIAIGVLGMGPDVATLTVLDGKGGLDFSFCLDVAHADLYYEDAAQLLQGTQNVIAEMRRRQKLLFDARVENIVEYNKLHPNNPLPYHVVIADELMSFDKESLENLSLFATQSRAMGGVLIAATQYPTVDVIPSQIQANLSNRLVGRLASSEHTRVALRRTKADNSSYEPAMIPQDMPGAMVLRRDGGNEILGRSEKYTRDIAAPFITEVVSKYPKINTGPQNGAQRATGVLYDDGRRLHAPLSEDEQDLITAWVEEYQDQGIRAPRRELTRRLYRHRGGKDPKFKGEGHIYSVVQKFLDNNGW